MKLKFAIQQIISAVEQEDMVVRFGLVMPIKRLRLELDLLEAQESALDMERPVEWDGRRPG